jgi:hypothetical protein
MKEFWKLGQIKAKARNRQLQFLEHLYALLGREVLNVPKN